MALEVARGMQALEEADPPILHRDLKPTNVFVGESSPPLSPTVLLYRLFSTQCSR